MRLAVKNYLNGNGATRLKKAFSMIEMALAMGVVSFAMVSLLGLIPVGLKMTRDTMDITVQSQIMQSISNDVQLTEYDKLQDLNDLNYNAEGLKEEDASKRVFWADLITSGSASTVKAPATTIDEIRARVIQVKIYRNNQTRPIYETSFLIANTRGTEGM
ncbi:MAG: Verru_Chthon cassette protein B [Verrucomicrobiales bacterium]|jgi:uncharacterized protein (TIGR02598 family)|nr:Verru_Chthon cassette protein B [Verrucomicrobiales bacterium]